MTTVDRLSRRRGIATVVVMFVLLVMTIGVFSYFSFMRARRLMQYRQLFGEFAHQLGRAALEMTRAEVGVALKDPDSDLYRELIKAQSEPPWNGSGERELSRIDFLVDHQPLMSRVADSFEGGLDNVTRLESRVFVLPEETDWFKPYPWAVGIVDTRQKYGRLFIEVESVFQPAALLEGVTRKLLGYIEFRVVSPLLPLLNHFSLFLDDPAGGPGGAEAINSIDTDFKGLVSGPRAPLVLNNGVTMIADNGKNVDSQFLQKQGWVYLGPSELELNLAFSHDETDASRQAGEDFHFYQQSADPAVRESQRAYADSEINSLLPDPFWEIRFWDQGINSLSDTQLQPYRNLFHDFDPDRAPGSSCLRLMGRPRSSISPTLVLGNVSAGFARISAANPKGASSDQEFGALFTMLPDLGPAPNLAGLQSGLPRIGASLDLDAAAQDPYNAGKLLFVDTAGGLDVLPADQPRLPATVYSRLQSGWVTRPYNLGLLFLKGNNQEPDPVQAGLEVGVPPEYFAGTSGSDEDPRLSIPSDLLPEGERDLLAAPELRVESILATMAESDTFPEPVMRARSSGDATSPAAFLKKGGWLKGDTLDLGTILIWEREGVFRIPPIRKLIRGGILVADSFEIDSPIRGVDDGPPLMLLAREGGIRVTGRSPVFAILAAPRGRISAPDGMDLSGSILARGIDFQGSFSTSFVSHLRYIRSFKVPPWAADSTGSPAPDWSLTIDHSRDLVVIQ